MPSYKCEHCGYGVCMTDEREPQYCPRCNKAMLKISD